jgi:Flp pilus assembly protein TadD
VALSAAAAIIATITLVVWNAGGPLPSARGGGQGEPAYVDDRSCARCHRAQHEEWSGSHHDKAMQPAAPRTVLGDFNNARLTSSGVTSRFFKRDGKFFVNTEGPDGRPADFEIKYTFGVEPLQQYLVEFPGGRLQSLTVAWDAGKKRWFHLYPSEKIPPGDPLHWTGRYQNWNLMCAECHTTNLRKGYDPETDSYQTTWDALNVGCQACHGPGRAHAAWADAVQAGKVARGGDPAVVVKFTATDPRRQADACARCHSRRTRLAAEERAGRPFLDEFRPELLRAGLYYADGQQLDEVYEYGSFRQSTMYQRGVRCTDCHNPHSLTLKAAGDVVCTQCHRPWPDTRFPGLAAKAYDSAAHHFHRADSAGARCVNCHMPAGNYMVIDARRDHSFRAPRPDLSVKLGTPNACNTCHANRSARWAAAVVQKWYGPKPHQPPHYGEVIAAGRARARDAEPGLIALAGDAKQPAIVRATALDLLRGYGPAGVAAIVAATKDEDPLVRAAAVGGLDRLPPRERLAPVAPLLNDPIRAVRIEAARVLAGIPVELFDRSQRQAVDAALAELKDALMAMADMPSARLGLGVLYEKLGQRDLAEQSYQAALRMDPYFFPARANLAGLYKQMGRSADAERALREGIKRAPAQGELHHSLGLLLAEEKRFAEAAGSLREAARLLPDRARVRYDYGLTLQQLGRRAEAEATLRRAHELDRDDPQIVYALAIFYTRQQQYRRALAHAQRLAELVPGDPGARQLLERIQQQLASGDEKAD